MANIEVDQDSPVEKNPRQRLAVKSARDVLDVLGDRHPWGRHVEGGRGVRGRRHREDGKLTGEDGREAMRGWPRMAKGGCSRDCEKAATKDGLDGYGNHGR